MVFALMFIVSLSMVRPLEVVAAQSQYYNKEFAWDYGGRHWTWNLSIPVALYEAYKAVPVSTRTQNGPAGYGFLTTTEDYYLQTLAGKLNETTTQLGYNSFDQVSFVLAFVQSLPYTSDSVTTGHDEYPRFPIETLVDDGGDCEDTSILFATITLILGYGTVYINPPDHYAVGVLGNNLHGAYWTYNGKTYYYCETTGDGFKIGDLPDEFKGQSAYIYAIDESQQYVPDLHVKTIEPSPTFSLYTPTPASTLKPDTSGSPTVAAPTIQPAMPLSFNLIADNPFLFILIVLAIIVSVAVAVKSGKRTREQHALNQTVSTQSSAPRATDADLGSGRFCIYCGSNNKSFATYCEKCGKKIS
jgi:hypothetical protein